MSLLYVHGSVEQITRSGGELYSVLGTNTKEVVNLNPSELVSRFFDEPGSVRIAGVNGSLRR
jgi:hypothetical protein